MEFFKQHWFKMLVLLPFIPVGILIHSLDRFTGVDDWLRFLVAFVFIITSLLFFFLGFYFELSKGDVRNKKIQLNIGNYEFGIAEISRVVLSILVIAFFYTTFNLATMSTRFIDIIDDIAAAPDVPSERIYSLVAMSDFDVHNQGSYVLIGVLNAGDEARDLATDEFLHDQHTIFNPIPVAFATPFEMINALYDGEIEAIIIGSNFVQVFEELDRFRDIEDETHVLNQFSVEVEVVERVDIDPREPFSILLMGLNSRGELSSGQINTFMLLTINLEDLSFTIVSIPRDSYVPIPCWNYVNDKLSHTNVGGSACAVGAIENMLDIEISHYVRINFTGFMELIDVLGGIEVDVPTRIEEQDSRRRFGEHMIILEPGPQILNGEEALALTRHRRSFLTQDFARVGNQQLVFQAMLSEMFDQVNGINDLLPFLEVMGRSVETSLSSHDITTIAQYLLGRFQGLPNADIMSEMHFINMIVLGDPAMISVRNHGRSSVVLPWPRMIAEAQRLMRINLGLEDPEFSFVFEFNGFNRPRTQWGGGHAYGSGILPPGTEIYEPIVEPEEDESLGDEAGIVMPNPPDQPSHTQRPNQQPPQQQTPPQDDGPIDNDPIDDDPIDDDPTDYPVGGEPSGDEESE